MSLRASPLYSSLQEILYPILELFPRRLRNPYSKPILAHSYYSTSLFEAWLASRTLSQSKGDYLSPGAHRSISADNLALAFLIFKRCVVDFFAMLWTLHPFRIVVMISFDTLRGVFPAFRGYSQALIIDELQTLISTGNYTWSRLTRLILTEICRMALESAVDSFATSNEAVVQNSARFVVEYKQMNQRIRMDVPTLADPDIRDLFHESDLFVRSFSGVSGFGLLSPFDFIRVLSLVSELASHALVLWSLTSNATHHWVLIVSVASTILPLLLPFMGCSRVYYGDHQTAQEVRSVAKQEKMRTLAYSDTHRPEVSLFGLGPWILQTWASARKVVLGLESLPAPETSVASTLLSQMNISDLLTALQNIPLVLALQSSSASLGSFTLYRSSVQSFFFTAKTLWQTVLMAFQAIFLLGAFGAAMEVEPKLKPKREKAIRYRSSPGGMKIEARNLSYSYPGSKEPALQNVNLTVNAGETLAIVGFNGSGKSTLANILLRISEFHEGELLINGHDIRSHDPAEYHSHVTAVFQGFSRFNASVKENIGVGYVPEMSRRAAVEKAAQLAGAAHILGALPRGLKTKLECSGNDAADGGAIHKTQSRERHGLSGGEWQRVAISRAFMRAHRPEVELLVFDEPTSSLDAHAQNRVFDTVEKLSRAPSGERKKTVIFITHRLSTARRADKIAMMENGTIIEFGTHQDLMKKNGAYASLYLASV